MALSYQYERFPAYMNWDSISLHEETSLHECGYCYQRININRPGHTLPDRGVNIKDLIEIRRIGVFRIDQTRLCGGGVQKSGHSAQVACHGKYVILQSCIGDIIVARNECDPGCIRRRLRRICL